MLETAVLVFWGNCSTFKMNHRKGEVVDDVLPEQRVWDGSSAEVMKAGLGGMSGGSVGRGRAQEKGSAWPSAPGSVLQ